MDSLPAEIHDRIIEELKWWEKLAPYASVSRKWKARIERHTFNRISLKTTGLDEFSALFAGPNISRRESLRLLYVDFQLPDIEQECDHNWDACLVHALPDRQADSAIFSRSVAELFTILKDLELRAPGRKPISLFFFSASRDTTPQMYDKDERWCHLDNLLKYDAECEDHSRSEIIHAMTSQIELDSLETLPTLLDISTFKLSGHEELESLKLDFIPGFLQRLPCVEHIGFRLDDRYELGRLERISRRKCLAQSAGRIDGQKIRSFSLSTGCQTPFMNETIPLHNLGGSEEEELDPLGSMISHLSVFPCLTALNLAGGVTLDSSFFKKFVSRTDTLFPSLQELVVEFTAHTSDGRWFYTSPAKPAGEHPYKPRHRSYHSSLGPSDSMFVFGDEPIPTALVTELEFRICPDKDTFLPFLWDAATAVQCLPKLKRFILQLQTSDWCQTSPPGQQRRSVFELSYFAAGTSQSRNTRDSASLPNRGSWLYTYPPLVCDSKYLEYNRVYWRVADWLPWEEIQERWHMVAGHNAKVVFLDEDQWTRDYPIEYIGKF